MVNERRRNTLQCSIDARIYERTGGGGGGAAARQEQKANHVTYLYGGCGYSHQAVHYKWPRCCSIWLLLFWFSLFYSVDSYMRLQCGNKIWHALVLTHFPIAAPRVPSRQMLLLLLCFDCTKNIKQLTVIEQISISK